MTNRALFLLLVLLQAAHSVEEYTFGLYRWLTPFKRLEAAIPGAARITFGIVNISLIALGLWCYLAVVARDKPGARAWMVGWCFVEILNGIGHPTWSVLAGSYVPGTITAPLLLATAVVLMWRMRRPQIQSHR